MSETEEKKHDASDRKLRKKREEGSIANAQESTGMFSAAAGIAISIAFAVPAWKMAIDLIDNTPNRFNEPFDEAVEAGMNAMFDTIFFAVLPVVAGALVTSILLTLILNKGLVFAIKPVLPDLERIAFGPGLKRIFGKRGWKELGVASIRLTVWIIFVTILCYVLMPQIVQSVNCGLHCQFVISSPIINAIFVGAIVILLISAVMEIIIQRSTFLEEQKMTDTEKKRERKDQSGSPEIRQERNRLRQLTEATSNTALNASYSTIVFRAKQGLVGINYNPPEQPVPLVCVKARTDADQVALIKQANALGIPVMDNERIVKNTINKGKSEMLDVAYFRDFALALAAR
jgi:type III secretion protein U